MAIYKHICVFVPALYCFTVFIEWTVEKCVTVPTIGVMFYNLTASVVDHIICIACGHLGATSGDEAEYVTTTVERFRADSVVGPVARKVVNVLQILCGLYVMSDVLSR
jgi:hypothetical protein